jgi:NAD(P)H dehydrogenase (quinone)
LIIVTGATGELGRSIVEQLIRLVPANQVGVSVRDPQKASELMALGVRVRRGDFAEPDTLSQAFEGATQVLIVSSNAAAYGGAPLAQHRSAIDAAQAAGAKRILYTSHMGASMTSAFRQMLDHAATEDMLRHSGLAWTALRHGFYTQSGIMLIGDALETGVIVAPADGKVSWTAHADLAEADAIVLANEGRYDGPTPPLTGSQALDLADFADIASELQAKTVQRQIVTDEDFRAKLMARGMPASSTDMILGLYIASRHGEFASVHPCLEQLIGRAPLGVKNLMAEKLRN